LTNVFEMLNELDYIANDSTSSTIPQNGG
jgi:hypothetical protein